MKNVESEEICIATSSVFDYLWNTFIENILKQ